MGCVIAMGFRGSRVQIPPSRCTAAQVNSLRDEKRGRRLGVPFFSWYAPVRLARSRRQFAPTATHSLLPRWTHCSECFCRRVVPTPPRRGHSIPTHEQKVQVRADLEREGQPTGGLSRVFSWRLLRCHIMAQAPVADCDQYDDKVNFGENECALRALEQQFANFVKCVYVDPPFKTRRALCL